MPISTIDSVPGIDVPAPLPAVEIEAVPARFPARTRQRQGVVNGVRTEVAVTQFADKILATISQDGRLAHWVHVPLTSEDPGLGSRRARRAAAPIQGPGADDDDFEGDAQQTGVEQLPLPHLTATTILGAASPERDTFGQLLAAQIGSTLAARSSDDNRLLVLGMGLVRANSDDEREVFQTLVGLVMDCL